MVILNNYPQSHLWKDRMELDRKGGWPWQGRGRRREERTKKGHQQSSAPLEFIQDPSQICQRRQRQVADGPV